jgi:hypothetical protein
VPLSVRKLRFAVIAVAALAVAPAARAQQFGIGATYGWFNDVEDEFRLQNFRSPNWEAWLEMKLSEDAVLRATYGRMRVPGDNVGKVVSVPPPGAPVPPGSGLVMPEYLDRIQYVTVSVSYLLSQGPVTTGLFGGVGGYGIRPESVSPTLDPFRDQRERVFGWHAGVEGDVRIARGFSFVSRVTFHGIRSETRRSLLTGSVGALYRF